MRTNSYAFLLLVASLFIASDVSCARVGMPGAIDNLRQGRRPTIAEIAEFAVQTHNKETSGLKLNKVVSNIEYQIVTRTPPVDVYLHILELEVDDEDIKNNWAAVVVEYYNPVISYGSLQLVSFKLLCQGEAEGWARTKIDRQVKKLAEFVIGEINTKADASFSIAKVLSAETRIVTGRSFYRIAFEVTDGQTKGGFKAIVLEDGENGPVQLYSYKPLLQKMNATPYIKIARL